MNGDSDGVIDYVDITAVTAVAMASADYDDMDNYRNEIDASMMGRKMSEALIFTGTRPAAAAHAAEEFDDRINDTAPKANTKKRSQWTLTRGALLAFKVWDDEIKGGPVPLAAAP